MTDTNGLISSMAQRLSQLEGAHRKLRDEVIKKDKELLIYQRKVQALESKLKENNLSTEEVESYESLMKENFRLRKQVSEMEKFLNDYGLVWIGNTKIETPKDKDEYQIDFKLLFKRFQDLNHLAGKGGPKMKKEGNKAKFVFDDAVPIKIYKNGILIRRGPFRPYTDKSTQRFIQDVLDGYFPYEYKDSNPEGVAFDVDNRCTEVFDGPTTNDEGQKLGKKSDSNIKSLATIGDKNMKMSISLFILLAREEFLSRLPPTAIKNGQVIDVRDSLAKKLGVKTDENPKSDSPQPIKSNEKDLIILPSKALEDIQNNIQSSEPVTTLRVYILIK